MNVFQISDEKATTDLRENAKFWTAVNYVSTILDSFNKDERDLVVRTAIYKLDRDGH